MGNFEQPWAESPVYLLSRKHVEKVCKLLKHYYTTRQQALAKKRKKVEQIFREEGTRELREHLAILFLLEHY